MTIMLTTRKDAETFADNSLRGWFFEWTDEVRAAVVGYVWTERRQDAGAIAIEDLLRVPEIVAAMHRANANANRRAAAQRRRKGLARPITLRLPEDLDAAIRGSLAPGQTIAGRIAGLLRAGLAGEPGSR